MVWHQPAAACPPWSKALPHSPPKEQATRRMPAQARHRIATVEARLPTNKAGLRAFSLAFSVPRRDAEIVAWTF